MSPPHEGFDWWRDSTVRYAGYTNEFGEAFRPLVSKHFVAATYVVALGYAAGDAADKTRLAHEATGNWRDAGIAGTSAALWQLLASVTVPAFFVNRQVSFTTSLLTKYRPNYMKSSLRLAPTLSGLAIIPALPYLLDPPITMFVDAVIGCIKPSDPKATEA